MGDVANTNTIISRACTGSTDAIGVIFFYHSSCFSRSPCQAINTLASLCPVIVIEPLMESYKTDFLVLPNSFDLGPE